MKRILIVLSDGFEELEAIAPLDILNRAGIEVTVASLKPGNVTGVNKLTIVPNLTLDEVNQEYDGILIPGGLKNAKSLGEDKRVIKLVQDYYKKGLLVSSICASPYWVLAKTGIIEGKTVTCYKPVCEGVVEEGKAKLANGWVAVDGNIITATGPESAYIFGAKIVGYLLGEEAGQQFIDQWKMVDHKWKS